MNEEDLLALELARCDERSRAIGDELAEHRRAEGEDVVAEERAANERAWQERGW